jgi:hypothetical protein
MRRLIDRCAGIDVGQALLVVRVRLVDSAGKLTEEIRSFGATTPDAVTPGRSLATGQRARVAARTTSTSPASLDARNALANPRLLLSCCSAAFQFVCHSPNGFGGERPLTSPPNRLHIRPVDTSNSRSPL